MKSGFHSLEQKCVNLIIKSYIHHHHLPSDTDPAGATGIVGVHAAPEPHLDGETHKQNVKMQTRYHHS